MKGIWAFLRQRETWNSLKQELEVHKFTLLNSHSGDPVENGLEGRQADGRETSSEGLAIAQQRGDGDLVQGGGDGKVV